MMIFTIFLELLLVDIGVVMITAGGRCGCGMFHIVDLLLQDWFVVQTVRPGVDREGVDDLASHQGAVLSPLGLLHQPVLLCWEVVIWK